MPEESAGPPARAPELRTIAMPADTNGYGDIFGGWLLSQMDLAGGSYAIRAAEGRVATVGINAMRFHLPVYVGDIVSCYCHTVAIGNTSIQVMVEAWAQRMRSEALGEPIKVTEGIFAFVAIDSNGAKRAIVRDPGVEV